MNGPEHYREAERLLAQAKAEDQRLIGQAMSAEVAEMTHRTLNRMVADAQVHATLALAAATALPRTGEMTIPDCEAWERAASAADLPPQSTAL